MPNLGDKLRHLEAAKAAEEAKRAVQEAAQQRGAEGKRNEGVCEYFENLRAAIELSISTGKIPTPSRIPIEIRVGTPKHLQSPDHFAHTEFAEFERWATGEGLEVIVERELNSAPFAMLIRVVPAGSNSALYESRFRPRS